MFASVVFEHTTTIQLVRRHRTVSFFVTQLNAQFQSDNLHFQLKVIKLAHSTRIYILLYFLH